MVYSPYGTTTDAPVSKFGFAGEWTDPTTGHSYLRARWLDTTTGTFLSEDPLTQSTGQAFGYTAGNPLQQIDPLGLFSINPSQIFNNAIKPIQNKINAAIIETQKNLAAPIAVMKTAVVAVKTGTEKVSNNVGKWVMENPDVVSAILTVASLATAAIPPVSITLAIGSTVFGAIATSNDINRCLPEKVHENNCNPASLTLNALGTFTGAVSLFARAGSFLTKTASTLDLINLDNLGAVNAIESIVLIAVNKLTYSVQKDFMRGCI